MSLKINLGELSLSNPIMAASGTFGFGYEMSELYDINILGSFATKGTTLEMRYGNKLPRIAEVKSGMINAIGLQNPGVEKVIGEEFIKLKKVYNKQVFVNVGGSTINDYVTTCKMLNDEDIVCAIELNVSCPNVKCGGIHFGIDSDSLTNLVTQVKNVTTKKVYVKLSPNVTDIVSLAKACEKAGADGLVLINTLGAMRIDIDKRKPVIDNVYGGLSGECIFSVALKNVYQVYKSVNIPIIGVGGISSARDVVEMMMAGASAVQIGSANLIDPFICKDIISDLEKLLVEMEIKKISDIIGVAHE